MSNPTTPFGWQMPENTDLVTDLPADFEVFGQAVATDLQYLLGGTTGQVLAKASATDLDFDWVTDATGMTNPMTTTGDSIYSSSGSTPARLGIGSAGQVLTVTSGLPSWTTISSGGMTLISETVASALSSLSFTSLGSYKQLLVEWCGIKHSAQGSDFTIRLNADSTGANYQCQGFNALGTTLGFTAPGNSGAVFSGTDNSPFGLNVEGNQLYQVLNGYFLLDDYTSSTKFKNYRGHHGFYNNTTNVYSAAIYNGFYASASAVTSIDITRLTGSQTFSNITNSTIRLYGIS